VGTPVGIPTEGGTAFVDQFDLQVSAGAGSLGVAVPKEPIPFNANWLRRHGLRASEVAMLEVRGDSMEPILFDGDAVLVAKRSSKPKSGKMYVVARPDSVQVKWVTVLRSAVQLVSENDAYPPERVEGHDGPQFFRVCWFSHFLR
jgi:phage repressor protein C with HTH and peptisase S24 domain